jgi:hypothetical protein
LTFAFAFALIDCADESDYAACAWLFAPPSFVDAGDPGCTAEPAGQSCDASSGRCQNVCATGEYLLICRPTVVTQHAIPAEALPGPVLDPEHDLQCNPIRSSDDVSQKKATYCCRCER